jgi:predicted DNA-binding protein (MmcQ/YjbR family)
LNSIEKAISYIKENFKNVTITYFNQHIKFSINGKIFAIIYKGSSPHIILKANGLFNKELRKEFKKTVMPSYTINSYHWNMILFDMEIPNYIIERLISNSHDEVISNMTKRQKDTYDHILKLS